MTPERTDNLAATTTANNEDNPYTMTEEILQKRLQNVNRGRYRTQLYAAITASLAALSFGSVLGWSSPILYEANYITEHLSADQQSWIASIVALGAAFGIIPWAYCNDRYGPKKTMLFQAPFNILSWVIMAIINYSNGYMASRFFCGFLSISYMVSGECLLIDTVHQKNLQHMFVMYQSSVLLGVLLTWIMGQLLTRWVTTTICAGFCAIHAIFLTFLPESPVYLYDNSAVKAENALAWYRGRKDIYTEMQAIKQYSEMRKIEPTGNNTMLYSKVVMKGLLIAMGIKFFSISSGYYVFLFYNVNTLYHISGMVDTFHDTIIYGVLMYVSSFVSMMIHFNKRCTLRKPLITSSVLVTVVLIVFTVYLGLASTKLDLDKRAKELIPILCVCLLIPAYETGLSCYAEIALMDYMPYEVYPKARNFLKIWHWFLVFLLIKNVITVRDLVPVSYACILLMATLSFIGIFFMVIFVVETKGKSLVEVQKAIGGNPIGSRGRLRHHVRIVTNRTSLS